MVHSCVAVMNQGKHRLSREPSTKIPMLSHFSAHGAATSSLYKDLINMADKSSENGNVICAIKMRKGGIIGNCTNTL